MTRTVLCLNAGSSSLKFALYEQAQGVLLRRLKGAVENLSTNQCRAWYQLGDTNVRQEMEVATTLIGHRAAIEVVFKVLGDLGEPVPQVVGHRVVHGGLKYAGPVRIDESVMRDLRDLVPLAPLHQPPALAVIEAVAERLPDSTKVACFDTAIHRRMPEVAQRFPLPRWLWDEGVRRYGFHGLSYEFLLDAHPHLRQGRTLIAHLGHGASLAAFLDGVPQDTTMGFTPTGGLMMGTRSGDLDPSVLVYLMKRHSYGPSEIDHLLNTESGLQGVSGLSGDMQTLEREAAVNERASQAIDLLCHSVIRFAGGLIGVLGGLDQLVFTAGIGEHSALVRESVCRRLAFLGIELDDDRNQRHARIITSTRSRAVVFVLPTDEEQIIARHALAVQ